MDGAAKGKRNIATRDTRGREKQALGSAEWHGTKNVEGKSFFNNTYIILWSQYIQKISGAPHPCVVGKRLDKVWIFCPLSVQPHNGNEHQIAPNSNSQVEFLYSFGQTSA